MLYLKVELKLLRELRLLTRCFSGGMINLIYLSVPSVIRSMLISERGKQESQSQNVRQI